MTLKTSNSSFSLIPIVVHDSGMTQGWPRDDPGMTQGCLKDDSVMTQRSDLVLNFPVLKFLILNFLVLKFSAYVSSLLACVSLLVSACLCQLFCVSLLLSACLCQLACISLLASSTFCLALFCLGQLQFSHLFKIFLKPKLWFLMILMAKQPI